MQFITALFGGIDTTYLNSAFALGIVLVLIVLGLWMLKQFTRAGGNIGRGRNRRLTVVDSAMVDGKRQVVIIRRDNVEHLIMTGGPQDLVIETGIAVTEPQQPRRPGRAQSAAQPAAEPTHSDDISPPHPANGPVTRDAVDRLNDLARPAPLKPRTSLRHTGLMRPSAAQDASVIPIAPPRRVDKSTGALPDSATTGAGDDTDGQTRIGVRNRFFRSGFRDDRA